MSEEESPERTRQKRAELVNAFKRRAWQPTERPQLGLRLLAGGIAVAAVAGVAFGVSALVSYNHKKKSDDHGRGLVMQSQRPAPAQLSPSATPSHSATPKLKIRNADPGTSGKPARKGTGAKAKSKKGKRTTPRLSTKMNVVIRNVMTGQCVDIPGQGKGKGGGRIQQHRCEGTGAAGNQLWDVVVSQPGAGPLGSDLFSIRNSKDDLCFDVTGRGDPGVVDVRESRCDPGSVDNQMWYLETKHAGQYWIRNVAAGSKCLDVTGLNGSGPEDAPLLIVPCDPKDDHLWKFS